MTRRHTQVHAGKHARVDHGGTPLVAAGTRAAASSVSATFTPGNCDVDQIGSARLRGEVHMPAIGPVAKGVAGIGGIANEGIIDRLPGTRAYPDS